MKKWKSYLNVLFFTLCFCTLWKTGTVSAEDVYVLNQNAESYQNQETVVIKSDAVIPNYSDDFMKTYPNVKKLVLEEGVTKVTVGLAAQFLKIETLELPSTVKSVSVSDFFKNLKEIKLSEKNKKFQLIDGVLYEENDDGTLELSIYPSQKTDVDYVVPETLNLNTSFMKNENSYVTKLVIGKNQIEDTFFNYSMKSSFPELKNVVISSKNSSYCSKNGVPFNKAGNTLVGYPPKHGTSYSVPKKTKIILNHAFSRTELKKITLPEGLETIQDYGFESTALTTVTLPKSLEKLYENSFSGASLKSITVAPGNRNYFSKSGVVYNKARTKLIYWPEQKKVTKLILPSTLQSLRISQIPCFTQITTMVIPKGMKDLNGFGNCLKSVTMEKGNCTYRIKNGIVYTKDYSSLILYPSQSSTTKVVLAEGLKELNLTYFQDVCISELTLPASLKKINDFSYDGWVPPMGFSQLKSVKVKAGNKYYKSADGMLYNKSMTTLYWVPANKSMTSFTVPSSVRKLDYRALSYQNYVEEITVPESCQYMAQKYHEEEKYIFYLGLHCPRLKAVNITKASGGYCSVDGVVYNADKKEMVLYPMGKTDEEYIIINGCEKVDLSGQNPYLKKLVLGDDINSVTQGDGTQPLIGYTALEDIEVSSKNPFFQSINGGVYSKAKDSMELYLYPFASKNTTYTLPTKLKTVYFPMTLMYGKNLEKVVVPELNDNYYVEDKALYTSGGKKLFSY